MQNTAQTPGQLLQSLFARAVEVADPMRSLGQFLPTRPAGRVIVVGAGKASARMAEVVEAAWGPCEGLVITRYGYGRPCKSIEIVEAAHPVPDQAGLAATARMLDLIKTAGEGDFVLALISGGASALLVAPAEGLSLEDKQGVNAELLACGAPITEMNTVRKHLSRVKGGQLAAAAAPARMLCLIISDVPGDDPAFIGSGPTVGDCTTPADALSILNRWQVEVSPAVRAALAAGSGVVSPDDPRLKNVENLVFAAPSQSLKAAAELAGSEGCEVHFLGDALEGEARIEAARQAEIACKLKARRKPGDRPLLILSGGELTVTRRGNGIGGPNAEFCLALAIALKGEAGIYALACDTDGVDGAAEIAGAMIDPQTLEKAEAIGCDPHQSLLNNDAHNFFAKVGGQIITGPTLTNVNDFRAILIAD